MPHDPGSMRPVVLPIQKCGIRDSCCPQRTCCLTRVWNRWYAREISYKWYLYNGEFSGSRFPESRGRRDSKRLQTFTAKCWSKDIGNGLGVNIIWLGQFWEVAAFPPHLPHTPTWPTQWECWWWGAEPCLAKRQVSWGPSSELVINFHLIVYVPLVRMCMGAAFLRVEKLAVLPRCVAGTMMTATWGEKESAVLPATGLWRSVYLELPVTWTLVP